MSAWIKRMVLRLWWSLTMASAYPQAPTDDRIRYGLQGLSTLVSDSGGELLVDSEPNEGTTVTLRIRAA